MAKKNKTVINQENNMDTTNHAAEQPADATIETTQTGNVGELVIPETAALPVAEKPEPIFTLIAEKKRVVRNGFETVLLTELAKGPGTTAELVDRMLASGEFHRVAPAAASKRPFKPTNFLLRQWTTEGMVTTATVVSEQVADVAADSAAA
jgi:hypothetical protein